MDYLRKFKTRINNSETQVLLITDVERIIMDKNDKQIQVESSLQGLDFAELVPQNDGTQEWFWELAPQGELDPNFSLILRISAAVL